MAGGAKCAASSVLQWRLWGQSPRSLPPNITVHLTNNRCRKRLTNDLEAEFELHLSTFAAQMRSGISPYTMCVVCVCTAAADGARCRYIKSEAQGLAVQRSLLSKSIAELSSMQQKIQKHH